MADEGPLIIAVGGSRGGVGKSVVAANLAVSIARLGVHVMLLDADLGAATGLHELLGLAPKAGVQAFLQGRVGSLADVLLATRQNHLQLVPALGGVPVVPAAHSLRAKLLKQVRSMPADVVVLDCGAGVTTGFVDFFQVADVRLAVTTPALPALQGAYTFLKGAVYRALRQRAANATEADLFVSAATRNAVERLRQVVGRIEEQNPEFAQDLAGFAENYAVHVIGNQLTSKAQVNSLYAFTRMIKDFLSIRANVLCTLQRSVRVQDSVGQRVPFLAESDRTPEARVLMELGYKLLRVDVRALREQRARRRLSESMVHQFPTGMLPTTPDEARPAAGFGGAVAALEPPVSSDGERTAFVPGTPMSTVEGSRAAVVPEVTTRASADGPGAAAAAPRRDPPAERSSEVGIVDERDDGPVPIGVDEMEALNRPSGPAGFDSYQRRHERRRVAWPVTVRLGDYAIDMVAVDVSESGASLRGTRLPFVEGETVEVAFRDRPGSPTLRALVRHAQADRLGIEFVDAARDTVLALVRAAAASVPEGEEDEASIPPSVSLGPEKAASGEPAARAPSGDVSSTLVGLAAAVAPGAGHAAAPTATAPSGNPRQPGAGETSGAPAAASRLTGAGAGTSTPVGAAGPSPAAPRPSGSLPSGTVPSAARASSAVPSRPSRPQKPKAAAKKKSGLGWPVKVRLDDFEVEAHVVSLDEQGAVLAGERLPFVDGEVVEVVFVAQPGFPSLRAVVGEGAEGSVPVAFAGPPDPLRTNLAAQAR